MIGFIGTYGYVLLLPLMLLLFPVVALKMIEGPPTKEENDRIMKSIEYRGNTFLTTSRTESKWGTE